MIFPCRVFNSVGVLIREYTAKEVSKIHWKQFMEPERFSEGAKSDLRYRYEALPKNDYIPSTDVPSKNGTFRISRRSNGFSTFGGY